MQSRQIDRINNNLWKAEKGIPAITDTKEEVCTTSYVHNLPK